MNTGRKLTGNNIEIEIDKKEREREREREIKHKSKYIITHIRVNQLFFPLKLW